MKRGRGQPGKKLPATRVKDNSRLESPMGARVAGSRPRSVVRRMEVWADLDVDLAFSNPHEAWVYCSADISNLAHAWMPPQNDTTLPQTEQEKRNVVQALLHAMLDNSECLDKDSKAFTHRISGGTYYKREQMEKVCWDIMLLTFRLHTEGPQILSIYDQKFLKIINKTRNFTFRERIEAICDLLRLFKTRLVPLMKGDTLQHTVAAPNDALDSAHANQKQGRKRARFYKLGQAIEVERKKAGGAEQTRTADRDSGDEDANPVAIASSRRGRTRSAAQTLGRGNAASTSNIPCQSTLNSRKRVFEAFEDDNGGEEVVEDSFEHFSSEDADGDYEDDL
ncbi:hypothetical protein N0V90_005080 [Kalmusia sp. IMI 367209]|nr:hypothetical protein N0V90_005080 [Kalmusia sp. IMI 367209]